MLASAIRRRPPSVVSPILFALALTISGCIEGIPVTVNDVGIDQSVRRDGQGEGSLDRGVVPEVGADSNDDSGAPDSRLDAPWPAVSLCAWGWCLEGANEHGWPDFDLQAVWASSPTDVVVVTGRGEILRFDGTTWTADISPVSVPLLSVHGSSATDIFAVGAEGTIVHYDGNTWHKRGEQSIRSSVIFNQVYSWAPGNFVAGGSDDGAKGYVAWSTPVTISHLDIGDTSDIRAVAGTSATDLVAGGNGGKFYTCTDGISWVEKSSQPWGTDHIAAINDRGDGTLMLSAGNAIYRRTALSWAPDHQYPGNSANDIWGSGASDIWTLNDKGDPWRYDGASWNLVMVPSQPIDQPIGGPLNGGFATDSTFGIVVGSLGRVVQWDGSQLQEMFPRNHESIAGLSAVWATSATEAFIVGNLPQGVAALKRTASGYEQMVAPSPSFQKSMYGIWGSSATDIYAVGIEGTLMRYDGAAWRDVTVSNTRAQLNGVWGRSATDIWIVGTDSTTLHYDGTSWQIVTAPTTSSLQSVGGDATRTFAVGGSVVLRLEGTTWVDDYPSIGTAPFALIWVRAGSDPLIAGDGGLRRRLAADTWVDVDHPSELGSSIRGISGPASRIVLIGFDGYAEGTLTGGFTAYPERALRGATNVWATADQTLIINSSGQTMVEE